ncbi:hypothetical protein MIND_00296700 [Mycena indigotica]|uniref:Uncharacterized protein n=1 Tax=Mycena indigotica TaxID=2126181 RepID=A0A8H6WEA5_9AGAR|nr:uncharacterized protein MIND_00296700 [Mycena indigotica]KAF7309264.1 hypothetical protein MIND_00296700 [Mycena indigotica]
MAESTILPTELEWYIFRLAAYNASDLSGIRVLMQVAWRVKNWTEPLLYRVFAIGYSPANARYIAPSIPVLDFFAFTRLVQDKGPAWFAQTVEDLLLINLHPGPTAEVLAACTGVRRLTVSTLRPRRDDPAVPFESALAALTRLEVFHGRLDHFFDVLALGFHIADQLCLAHLTHAELVDTPSAGRPPVDRDRLWRAVLALPSLTHLACSTAHWAALSADSADAVVAALHPAGRLHAFVLIRYSPGTVPRVSAALRQRAGFVLFIHGIGYWAQDWSNGASLHEEGDFWTQADEFIRKRTAAAGGDNGDTYALHTPHPIPNLDQDWGKIIES